MELKQHITDERAGIGDALCGGCGLRPEASQKGLRPGSLRQASRKPGKPLKPGSPPPKRRRAALLLICHDGLPGRLRARYSAALPRLNRRHARRYSR